MLKKLFFTFCLFIFSMFAVAGVSGSLVDPGIVAYDVNGAYVTGHESMVNLVSTPASAALINVISMATDSSPIPDDPVCMAFCKETDNRFISALGSNYIERLAAIPIDDLTDI